MTAASWVTDPYRGSLAAAQATEAAQNRDRDGLLAAIAVVTPEERSVLVSSVADVPGVVDWLIDLLRDAPNDLWLNTIAAQAYLNWAWEARTAAQAKYVTAQGWEGFRSRSSAAADIVAHTRARHPGAGLIGMPALTVGLAGQGDADDFRRALAEADTAFPDDYWTARLGIDYFAEKWYGSTTQMWDYAVSRAQAAGDGSPLAALPAGAAVEQLLWARKSQGALGNARIGELLDHAAQRTVQQPGWRWTPAGWGAVNELILANLLAGRTRQARALHAQLGAERRTAWPWELLDPISRTKHFTMLAKAG